MLFHLAYRPLTLGSLVGHSDKNNFSPGLMKLYILVLKVFIKKNKFWGSVHFWACDITRHGTYKIGHISAHF